MKKNNNIILIILLTLILIGIDQISKIFIQNNYNEPIGNDLISISLVKNTGMAFGFNSGNTKNIILIVIIILIIINFIRNQKDRIDKKTSVAISMILAGGISNLIDRIIRGGVVDFIKIKHFAIFNIADSYIFIGWILLIIFLIKFNKKIIEVEDCEKQ